MKYTKRIFTFIITVALLAGNVSNVFAAETKTLLPSGVTYEDISTEIEELVKENEETTAGMGVALFNRNDVIYQNTFGYADKENQVLVDADTVFEWGSATKLLVWVSVMQLYEENKIDLNADIKTYLPENFFTNLNYDTPLTMMNLMNHNAGFQEMVSDLFLSDKNDILDLGDQLNYHQPAQIYEPGTVTAYSNWGVALAGYIVECISGESFYQYVNTHIFERLRMNHTAIAADLSDNNWVSNQRGKLQCYTANGKSLGNMMFYISLYPAGMCTGTLGDFLIFARALLPQEGETSPLFKNVDTLNMMLSPTSYYPNTDIPLNCHGFWTLEYGVEVLGHGGNTAGCSSYLLLEPNSGTGAVIMTNQQNEQIYNFEMMELIFGSFSMSELSDYNKEVLKGFFRSGRTITKGPLSLYSISMYSMEAEDLDNFWVYSNDNGLEKYTTAYGDMLKLSPIEYIPMMVLVILFAGSFLYSLSTLLIGGCIITPSKRRRIKKKGQEPKRNPFSPWNYASCGIILLFAINIGLLSIQAMIYAPSKYYQWQFAACGILGFAMAFLVGLLIKNWKKTNHICNRMQKIKYIVTAACLSITILVILYWKMYQFWNL